MPVDHDQLHPHTKLWFYGLAMVDMDEALRAAGVCMRLVRQTITQEYFDHVELCVLRYGRPFAYTNTPSGRKKTRLPGEFIRIAGMDQELHKRMIEARDSAVAHSDMTHKSVRLCVTPTGTPGVMAYGCEPSWTILGRSDVESFHATGNLAVKCLMGAISRILKDHGHELQRDREGWLTLSPHPDD